MDNVVEMKSRDFIPDRVQLGLVSKRKLSKRIGHLLWSPGSFILLHDLWHRENFVLLNVDQ